jgi:glutathione S-transferase
LMLGKSLGLVERYPAAVQAYWARLQQREAFQRAMTAQHDAAIARGVMAKSSADS